MFIVYFLIPRLRSLYEALATCVDGKACSAFADCLPESEFPGDVCGNLRLQRFQNLRQETHYGLLLVVWTSPFCSEVPKSLYMPFMCI